MEPDEPEQWHVAPVNDGGVLGPDEADDDEDPWWDEAGAGTGDGRAGPVRRTVFGGNSPRLTLAVALAAAVLGVVAALALVRSPPASPGVAGSAASPSSGPNQNGGGGNGGLPPLQGNGNGAMEMQVVGTVTAVSTTSITVGGEGQSMTAEFTAATKFSGRVRSPAGIKDGDQVAVVATGAPSRLTVTSIQDPASL
jgi:hypothetical protein